MQNNGVPVVITPSDSVVLPKTTRSIMIGGPATNTFKAQFPGRTGMGRVTAVTAGGVISAIQIENSGMGYTSTPTASVLDGNTSAPTGSGANITVTVAGGVITAFAIVSGGTGYHINDEVVIAGGLGPITLNNLAPGVILDLQVTQVFTTGTTATNIVGFF